MTNIFAGRARRPAVFFGGVLLAGAALAQTVNDESAAPIAGLNLPKDITIFGKSDPTIRKATAIVNGEIITDTDIDQRLALILAANGGKIPPEERDRLHLQVLRNLIDETLQIQEAKANKVEVTDADVQQSFARVAKNFKRSPAEMGAYLRTQGSSEASIKRQIRGELAWSRLLRRRVEPFINVSEEEVQAIIARLNASKGAQEFRLSEIFLSSTPETAGETRQNAQRIIDQLRQNGSFATYARQFSEASTAAVGGDLGWIRAAQLPDALAAAAQTMKVGEVTGPIEVPGGLSILLLSDQRQVLTADPRDAILSLKQMSITFPPGTTQAQATDRASAFANATRAIAGCGKVEETAAAIGAEVVQNDQIRVRDLPPRLQDNVINLQIGQATPPFGSVADGVRVLVLCGRDEGQEVSGPSSEQIRNQLEEARVNLRARRYLRDLRRDAVVEYR